MRAAGEAAEAKEALRLLLTPLLLLLALLMPAVGCFFFMLLLLGPGSDERLDRGAAAATIG